MEESQSGFYRQERMLGRRVIVIIPVFILVVAFTFAYLALPVRYFFMVENGELALMAGKIPWLSVQRSQAFEPISVDDMNVESMTNQVFESRADALATFRRFILDRLQEQNRKVLELEKTLVKPYSELLKNLRLARTNSVEGLDDQIDMLRGWLDYYSKKTEKSKGSASP